MQLPPDFDESHYDALVMALDLLIGNVELSDEFAEQLETLMISMDLFSDMIREEEAPEDRIMERTDNLLKVDFRPKSD
jgi:hypothetical protein